MVSLSKRKQVVLDNARDAAGNKNKNDLTENEFQKNHQRTFVDEKLRFMFEM